MLFNCYIIGSNDSTATTLLTTVCNVLLANAYQTSTHLSIRPLLLSVNIMILKKAFSLIDLYGKTWPIYLCLLIIPIIIRNNTA